MRPVVLDLNRLVEGLMPMLGRLIGSHVRLATSLDPDLCLVEADPGQLEQVIVNLVVNARDAMPDGGDVEIRTRRVSADPAEPVARLTVTDTGIGMDDATLARIFQPFFSTMGAARGGGLGLASVYGIVASHRGSIGARSRPGRGSTFEVDLPGVTDPGATAGPLAPGNRSQALPAAGRPATVLVVDDEILIRRLAARTLTAAGYRVLEAGDLSSAVALAAGDAVVIGLVVSDVVLPDAPGPEVVRRVTAYHPGARVVYMTGYAGDGLAWPAIPDLEAPVVGKPFALDDLVRRVRAELDGSPAGA